MQHISGEKQRKLSKLGKVLAQPRTAKKIADKVIKKGVGGELRRTTKKIINAVVR